MFAQIKNRLKRDMVSYLGGFSSGVLQYKLGPAKREEKIFSQRLIKEFFE